MEEQNSVNEEKDSNMQRQETKKVTGREKVSEGAIRKIWKQGKIATKPNQQRTPKKKRDKEEWLRKET